MGEDFAILLEGSRVHFNPTKLKKRFKTAKEYRRFTQRFDIQLKPYKNEIKGSKEETNSKTY